jgi:lipopolysaccharide transport system permease protein
MGTTTAPEPPFELVLESGKIEAHYWRDLWRYRELFLFLSWRDLLVRYKQTAIGVLWALLQPLLTMVAFTVMFGRIARLPSGDVPYPLLVFAGVLPWQFFSSSLSEASNSLIGNSNLLAKVYFPRIIIPASAVIVCFVDFLISSAILVGLFGWYRVLPDWRIVALPGFVLLGFMAAFGFGLWLTSLNVRYRDFRYVVPFMIQFGLFLSPVGFSASVIPSQWRFIYFLNPMVSVIEGFRWALLRGRGDLYLPGLWVSIGFVFLLLWGGVRYFRSVERTFADII